MHTQNSFIRMPKVENLHGNDRMQSCIKKDPMLSSKSCESVDNCSEDLYNCFFVLQKLEELCMRFILVYLEGYFFLPCMGLVIKISRMHDISSGRI